MIVRSRNRRWRRSRRGISDVVGTILLLGLTITLFGSIFVFVNSFPRPPPGSNGQFATSLNYLNVSGHTVISQVSILHLGGPTIFAGSNTEIYLTSQNTPALYPASGFTLGAGLAGAKSWSIGQTWKLNVTSYADRIADILTVSIVAAGSLTYSIHVQAAFTFPPPEFTNEGTFPAAPIVGHTFVMFAQIVDSRLSVGTTHPGTCNNPAGSVLLNYSLIPGFASAAPASMAYCPQNGTWQFPLPGVPTATGTYYVFVTATDSAGLSATIGIAVNIEKLSSSGLGQSPIAVSLTLAQPAVLGHQVNLTVAVTNQALAAGTLKLNVTLNGAPSPFYTVTSSIGGASVESFFPTWVPSAIGTANLFAQATVSGIGGNNGTLAITVFPQILLVEANSHYTSLKPYSGADESGWLAAMLTSAGFPYTTQSVSCSGTLGSVPSYTAYGVVLFDFGSSSSGCATLPTAWYPTLSGVANATNVWFVGANGWTTSGCPPTYFLTAVGLTKPAAGGCGATVTVTSPVPLTMTASGAANHLLAAGVPALDLNGTVAGNSTFDAFSITNALTAAPATTFLTVTSSGQAVGTIYSHGALPYRAAVTSADPSMLVTPVAGHTWGTGGAGTSVVFNVVNSLCGLSNATSSARQGTDFAVSEVVVIGHVHTAVTTIAAVIEENGIVPNWATVTLILNGTSPALYGGSVVSTTTVLLGGAGVGGGTQIVSLTWQASGGGPYYLSVQVSFAGDNDGLNNVFGTGIVSSPITFT
jgi:Archaeal Type IV pilin, N-terminal